MAPSRRAATLTLPPCGVNFTALLSRFQITCCRRPGSARTTPRSFAMRELSRMPRAVATGSTASTAPLTTLASIVSCSASLSLPEAMRDTSNRSSITCCWAMAARLIICTPSARSLAGSFSLASMRVHRRMVLSGVRSSWLTTAMNSSFARLASSARADARSAAAIAALSRSSVILLSVLSRMIFTSPVTDPEGADIRGHDAARPEARAVLAHMPALIGGAAGFERLADLRAAVSARAGLRE